MSNYYESLFELFLADPHLLEDSAREDLEIDPELPIDSSLYTQSSNYFKWSTLSSIAEARAMRQKYLVKENLYPKARIGARTHLESSRPKVTESQVEEMALLDSDYQSGLQTLHTLEAVASIFKAAERSMAQRADMLRSLNSRQNLDLHNTSSLVPTTRKK